MHFVKFISGFFFSFLLTSFAFSQQTTITDKSNWDTSSELIYSDQDYAITLQFNIKDSLVQNKWIFFEAEFPDQFIFDSIQTDTSGIIQYAFTPIKKGFYRFRFYTVEEENLASKSFRFISKSKFWPVDIIIGLFGGLGLFLFGIHLMSRGLQRTAGDKMRNILSSLTKNRFVAIGVGIFVTMVIQSSSATSVMLISFVQAGLLQFSQTVAILLGSGIGTTITAQLIAFKIADYALIFVGVGFFMRMLTKKEKINDAGTAILGFGLLFYGMSIMSDSMQPLRSFDPFIKLLTNLENPLIGILAGALFTALIQSSSAFIGIIIILGGQGIISLEAAIPLIFGANIGTSITAFLASINTSREAKKVALAHIISRVTGVLIFVWWIPFFTKIVIHISPGDLDGFSNMQFIPRQIANAHTLFNVGYVILFIPFINSFARMIDKILPYRIVPKRYELRLRYLDQNVIDTPVLALNLAKQETIRMARKVQLMVSDIIICFIQKDKETLNEIPEREEEINYLRDKIKTYILQTSTNNVGKERLNEVYQLLSAINELERIADVVAKNLFPKAENWIKNEVDFSENGKKEILEYHTKTQKQINRAIVVFSELNLEKAKEMKKKQKKYEELAFELEKQHFERLKENIQPSVKSCKIHLEIINSLHTISSHATNIARSILKTQITD